MGPHYERNFQNATPPTNRSQKFKLVLNFPPIGPHKITLGFLKFWVSPTLIFFENFKFTIAAYGETKKLSYLENERPWSKRE